MLLGSLFNNPSLFDNEKYRLDKTDFSPNRMHRILFASAKILYEQGIKDIGEMEIGEFIKSYPEQLEVLEDNNFMEFIPTVKKLSEPENFEYYYNVVRKFSLLRAYRDSGFDITKIYDDDADDDEQRARLNGFTIEHIAKYFDEKINKVKRQFHCDKNIEETQAGFGFMDIKESLKETPLWGKSFISPILTTLTRGAVNGQLCVFSSPTGVGKTTIMTATLAHMCATEIYDTEINQWIENPHKSSNGCLFIQFEMDNELECVPKFLSYISGVSTEKIMNGKYIDDEESRIDYGIKVMEESNINLVCMPNFTTASIESIIKSYVYEKEIDIVGFDYIQECSALNGELSKNNGGVSMRSDQVLQTLAARLKDIARELDIPIYSATQCNANVGTSPVMDASVVAGSRSLSNKVDIGAVIMHPTNKELEMFKPIMQKRGFNNLMPTHVVHLYKSRFSSHPMNLKVFWHIDMGTGRIKDLGVVDINGMPYRLKQ